MLLEIVLYFGKFHKKVPNKSGVLKKTNLGGFTTSFRQSQSSSEQKAGSKLFCTYFIFIFNGRKFKSHSG